MASDVIGATTLLRFSMQCLRMSLWLLKAVEITDYLCGTCHLLIFFLVSYKPDVYQQQMLAPYP